jgi:ferredoxin-NADP reductase
MNPVKKFESVLKKIEDITPTVKMLYFQRPKDFVFDAGQYLSLQLNLPDGLQIRRSYSICSSPYNKEFIELCIKKVEGGPGSNALHNMKQGDLCSMTGPLGHFLIKNRNVPITFIATGTGIAPLNSMIETLHKESFPNPVKLIFGIRYEDEIIFKEKYLNWNDEKNFSFHSVISKPRDPNYNGEKGHVQDIIKNNVEKEYNGHFYICGLNAMISEVDRLLVDMGFTREQIFFERYD